jgi:hypothetical protein
MSFVVQDGGPSTRPPKIRTRQRSRVGSAIAFVFTMFAFIVVACSGDGGDNRISDQAEPAEQAQPVCTPDGEGCGPPPRDPCGHDGEPCCRFNNFCQTGLVCHQGTCSMCGVPGGPCCNGNSCQSNSACQNGTCVRICGAQGLACCGGTTCDSGLACSGGTCQLCGNNGQTCCPGNTCNGGTQCIGGTCRVCGGNGQACCTSGAACGTNMTCQSGTCRPVCGYVFGPCCGGFDWQQCQFAGAGYACDEGSNRCEPCGGTSQPCCTSGFQCTSFNVCRPDFFGGDTCVHCGGNGEPCCSNNRCNNSGLVCSGGQCSSCGLLNQPCCSGSSCTQGVCQAGTCR